jgi:MFS transporter, DHA2 family, multidrug resistance protein
MTMPSPPQPDASRPLSARWLGFAALCTGMFMAILDIQIVATSLPAIQTALKFSPDAVSWIQTSYLIAEVIAIPLTGALTRALTLRGLFLAATTVFVAASIGCAFSTGFTSLIVWRSVQGFAGGALIPLVFSAAFLLFPARGQGLATTLAGMLAVLAPTIGPLAGGWITSSWSWPWLFLVNIAPGILAIGVAALCLARDRPCLEQLRSLDVASLALLAIALATLEIALKNAPAYGWLSLATTSTIALSIAACASFVRQSQRHATPIVDLKLLHDRQFTLGCSLSFILGIGLYGNVYLMPVFLAYVGLYDAFEIGQIMVVTGAAQLVSAPLVVWLERYIRARTLTLFGFALFAAGLALSGMDTPRAAYDEMFWPQMVRGAGIMFCLLPPTRIALGHIAATELPDASALFNLMRNLGGAIGLALIDTIIFGRVDTHGAALAARLLAFDPHAFAFAGLPMPAVGTLITPEMKELARPVVERAALTLAIHDAWILVAGLTAAGIAVAWAVSPGPKAGEVRL